MESGSAGSEAQLALSPDGNYLALGGYDAAVGTAKVGSAAGIKRTIARIDAAGNVDTTTALTGAFAGSNFRGVATDGTQFWGAGDGTAIKSGQPVQNVGVVNAAGGASTSTAAETRRMTLT